MNQYHLLPAVEWRAQYDLDDLLVVYKPEKHRNICCCGSYGWVHHYKVGKCFFNNQENQDATGTEAA